MLGHHDGLFRSAGHRLNLLDEDYREIGIGIEQGEFSGYNALMTTQNFVAVVTLKLTGSGHSNVTQLSLPAPRVSAASSVMGPICWYG